MKPMETISMKLSYSRFTITLLTILALSGCSNVSYYSQIVSGHMRIVMGKKPVVEVTEDELSLIHI